MQSLGAYYQCHKNAASFIRTIKSFQTHYPNNDIVVVNDGGYDYEYFCKKNNIKYIYTNKSNTQADALIFSTYESSLFFLENIFNSFKYISHTHIILLEDDVRVLKRHTMPFENTINGCNKNESLHIIIQNILKHEKQYSGPFYYGACGGCVIDKCFFEKIGFDKIRDLLYKIKDFSMLFASDVLLSFIALYFGGTIGEYSEFAEMWYPDIQKRLSNNTVAFLHQYKNDYEKNGVHPTELEQTELHA